MRKELIVLDPTITRESWGESYISFAPFTAFLKEKISAGDGIKIHYFQYVLDIILAHPGLQGHIAVEDMHRYHHIMELVATIAYPLMKDEAEFFLAFGNPMTPEVFYGSDAFYQLVSTHSKSSPAEPQAAGSAVKQMQYEQVLHQFYNYTREKSKEWVQGFINPASGLYRYYRININRRFTHVESRVAVPNLAKNEMDACFTCADGMKKLEKLLPLSEMTASGFTVITLTEVTGSHAVEQIGREVAGIDMKHSEAAFGRIQRLLQTLAGNEDYGFGIMPVFTINKRAALLYENFPYSIIVRACLEQGVPKKQFDLFIKAFLKEPAVITHSPDTPARVLPIPIRDALDSSGLRFYSLEPVYAGNRLAGIFEISRRLPAIGDDATCRANILPALPFVARLLQYFIAKFNFKIESIIKEQFTNIQPAVQWKFNEAAWHYFRNHEVEKKAAPVESISFGGVYPIYGAIDIQDSTIERNKALRQDLLLQLNLLKQIIVSATAGSRSGSLKAVMASTDHWLGQLGGFLTIEQELQVNDFLELKVWPWLKRLRDQADDELIAGISNYERAAGEELGEAHGERRKLESSIRAINTAVGQYLDFFKLELQSTYPCYFEKLRTDGVEYDIYMGQSIAPKMPFKAVHLQETRRLQLQSMAAICRLTNSLLPQLPHPLQTTQLIFVHSRPIDISFRNDERRFDVEGAYNIRYHIIKKRIDKVHVHTIGERLVQPGKIALVFYEEKDVKEYRQYIQQLQEQDILMDDLEQLELEELQGVSGLKALRVGVTVSSLQYND
jgi:hypothetical protein